MVTFSDLFFPIFITLFLSSFSSLKFVDAHLGSFEFLLLLRLFGLFLFLSRAHGLLPAAKEMHDEVHHLALSTNLA